MSSKWSSRRAARSTVNDGWSPVEHEVICLLLSGECASAKEIAYLMDSPLTTTYERLRRIRDRMDVRSDLQLVVKLIREKAA